MVPGGLVIERPGITTDDRGNTIKNWATATSTTVDGWVFVTTQTEIADGREAQVSTGVAMAPPDVVITSGDRVRFAGSVYEVDGPPQVRGRPTASGFQVSHVDAPVRAVRG